MNHNTAANLGCATQWFTALVGIWLMFAPFVLGYEEHAAAGVDRIVGPLIANFSIIAVWECTRNLRWLNLLNALTLLVLPWVLGYPTAATVNSTLIGLLVVALTFVPYPLTHRFGGGWASLWGKRRTDGRGAPA